MNVRIFLLSIVLLSCQVTLAQKQKVWLDADTGNEMDDLYAIARVVKDTSIDLVGLSSAHFNNPDLLVFEKWNGYRAKGLETLRESQRLNEEILKAMNRSDIPHPAGADRQIGRAWGGEEPRDSPALRAIVEAVKGLPPGESLHILTLGAVTNVASAFILAPEILPKVKVFMLGAKYDSKARVWNKSEFNIRNDLNAFDYLLNLEGCDLTVMPIDTALPLQFDRDSTYERLNQRIPIENILELRWKEQNPQDKSRVMWDLALVEAYFNPRLAVTATVRTPPENSGRMISVITSIKEVQLANDFWKTLHRKD